jgi:O-antigen/teichoic acid export membrane protein
MYGLWVVLLVIAGRANVTRRNFPAALVGLAANVVLLIVLVPPYGIAGAGVALCGAYVVMLAVMYLLIRRAFPVSFEWWRMAHIVAVMTGLTVLGDLLLPTRGAAGFLLRLVVFLAIPAALLLTGFAHRQELVRARGLIAQVRRLRFS